MNQKDKAECGDLIAALFIAKGKQMPAGTLKVWTTVLESYPMDAIRAAFALEISSDDEWPNVGKIVKRLKPDVESEAMSEWVKIFSFKGYHPDIGWTLPRTWNDAADRALKEIGGFEQLVWNTPGRSMDFARKNFISAYENNSERIEMGNRIENQSARMLDERK